MRTFEQFHPFAAAAYFAAAAGVAMFSMDPVVVVLSLLGALGLCLLTGGLGHLRQQLWILALFVVLAAINPLTLYALLSLSKVVLPDSAFRIGFINGLMSESMIIWFTVFMVWHLRRNQHVPQG